MSEKNTEPEIYMDVKVTNNGWCVLDHDQSQPEPQAAAAEA